MEKITYLIGAGFSAIAGLPVMSNFIVKAKDLYYSDKEKYKSFRPIFDRIDELGKLKTYFNSDLLNIEELLSIYDMESTLESSRKKDTFSSFIIEVINSYSFKSENIEHDKPSNWLDFVYGKSTIHKNITAFASSIFQLEFFDQPASTIELAFRTRKINSNINYSIISLNYDTILESAVQSVSNGYNSNIIFEKEQYLDDWTIPMLFKLHGDIEKGKIIPPTWSKSIKDDMKNIWRNAFEVLKNSTQIRFLGYSLPISDTYFQYFLKASIKNNPYLKNVDILCLDRNNSVENRYRNVFSFRDLRFINGNISKYCEELWKKESHDYSRKTEKCNRLESVHSKFFEERII